MVWIEVIDWEEGRDPTYTSIVPITDIEFQELIAQGKDVSTDYIAELGQTRRWLMRDHTDGKTRVRWVDGHLRFCAPG